MTLLAVLVVVVVVMVPPVMLAASIAAIADAVAHPVSMWRLAGLPRRRWVAALVASMIPVLGWVLVLAYFKIIRPRLAASDHACHQQGVSRLSQQGATRRQRHSVSGLQLWKATVPSRWRHRHRFETHLTVLA